MSRRHDPNPFTARPSRDLGAIQANHDLNRVSEGPVISGQDFARWMWIARTLGGWPGFERCLAALASVEVSQQQQAAE